MLDAFRYRLNRKLEAYATGFASWKLTPLESQARSLRHIIRKLEAYATGNTMEEQVNDNALPQPVDPRLRATAYHEAGHAVMALLLGRPIQKVTVAPNQNYLGACQIQKGRFKPTKDWLEDEILILFAGMVAESQVTGRYCPNGASQDLRGIRRYVLMRTSGASQVERLERRLLDKTEYLLADAATWKAVESIAAELLKCETISGRAARHFYDLAEQSS